MSTYARHASCGLMVLALGLWGCSGDDENGNPNGPGGPVDTGAPDVSALVIDVPPALQAAANANPGSGAAVAVAYIQSVNAISAFVSYLAPPGKSPTIRPTERPGGFALSPLDSTTWSSGGLSVTVTSNQIVGSVTTFSVRLDGTAGEVHYDNYVYLDGYYFPDGSEGEFNVYSPTISSGPVSRWNWLVDPSDAILVRYELPINDTRISVNVLPTGAGDVSYQVGDHTQYLAEWNPNGSGSWSYLDAQGNIISGGTWT